MEMEMGGIGGLLVFVVVCEGSWAVGEGARF
jgi:hypothetical protein